MIVQIFQNRTRYSAVANWSDCTLTARILCRSNSFIKKFVLIIWYAVLLVSSYNDCKSRFVIVYITCRDNIYGHVTEAEIRYWLHIAPWSRDC